MKIVIPLGSFGRGGGHRVLSELGTAWVRLGHTTTFVTSELGPPVHYPTEAAVVWVDDAGNAVSNPRHGARRAGPPWPPLRGDVCVIRALGRHARDADVIFANHMNSAWPVYVAAKRYRLRAKLVQYVQAYEPELHDGLHGVGQRVHHALGTLGYLLPMYRIGGAPEYRDYKLCRTERTIAPGLSTEHFRRKPPERAWLGGPLVLGTIARTEPWKRTALVLQAYRAMREQGLPVSLRVCCFGPPPDELASLPDCAVIDVQNDAALGEYYRSIDVLMAACVSVQRGMHYPIMEALACGTGVITTDFIPATRQNSWVVPDDDSEAIVRAAREIIKAPDELRRRVDAGHEAMQVYAWSSVAEQMLAAFREA